MLASKEIELEWNFLISKLLVGWIAKCSWIFYLRREQNGLQNVHRSCRLKLPWCQSWIQGNGAKAELGKFNENRLRGLIGANREKKSPAPSPAFASCEARGRREFTISAIYLGPQRPKVGERPRREGSDSPRELWIAGTDQMLGRCPRRVPSALVRRWFPGTGFYSWRAGESGQLWSRHWKALTRGTGTSPTQTRWATFLFSSCY